MGQCLRCGQWEAFRGGRMKYCRKCAPIAKRERTRDRVRKHRAKKAGYRFYVMSTRETTKGKKHGNR